MDVGVDSFQPSNYSLEYPFFDSKISDEHIEILGRDDVIIKINSIINNRLNNDKYCPVIISTSRGMGRSFLLRKFGMQQIREDLKSPIIEDAIATGRILSFDFSKQPHAILNENDVYSFFPRLMVYFLCRIFGGTRVDGINFQKNLPFYKIEMTSDKLSSIEGQWLKFKRWLLKWQTSHDTDAMIDEYIRLTNIAFGTTHDAPPVFLLDGIHRLTSETNVQSSFKEDGTPQMHSPLSLLLTQLAGKFKPVCICSGPYSGNIESILEKSTISPQVLSLTPLVNDYCELWKQLTAYSNQNSPQYSDIKIDDEDLRDALVFASYQIPRLLCIAHSVWFDLRTKGIVSNREFYIQMFEQEAIQYYSEMVDILRDYSTEDIAHILLSCGVHWIVDDVNKNVPGTDIPWALLIRRSLIFPYLDGCYIFPFPLVWRVAESRNFPNKKEDIENKCAELVPNLNVKDLFTPYDELCSWENCRLGVGYETLFASSLAVKYYLRSISTGNSGYFSLSAIYDISRFDFPALNIMKKYEVNFSHGISLPAHEVYTNTVDLDLAVVHNRNTHNAHHDLILPARTSIGIVNIAVHAKVSFSDIGTIAKQFLVSPECLEQVQQLFLLYLGKIQREKTFDSVVCLDGRGCCNGLTLNSFILVKKKIL
jgi:hypothetical protein